MKDFDGLLTEIDGLKAEKARLQKEKKEYQERIAEDIIGNLKNIYLPFIDKVKSVEDKFGNIGEHYSSSLEFEGMQMSICTRSTYSSNFTFMYKGVATFYVSEIKMIIGKQKSILDYDDKSLDCLAKTFGNSLVAQNFVEKCIDVYSERLESIASYYRGSNEKLADTVEKLKAMIAENSKVVKEKEDGSVEITLGGKVYVGHLKEKEED